MSIHNRTFLEAILEEMYDAEFRPRRDFHEGFFVVFDFRVGAIALVAEVLGAREFGVELLEALFAEGGEGGVVFEGGEERVFIIRGVLLRGVSVAVKDLGDVRIERWHFMEGAAEGREGCRNKSRYAMGNFSRGDGRYSAHGVLNV